MPNQIPFGYMEQIDPNNMNIPNIQNNNYKLKELEERIKILENKINKLEENKIYNYDYKTSMQMM